MRIIEEVKRWVCEITEIALLLVALGIVFEILFGGAVPFFGSTSVVANLTKLIGDLGDNGLVGLVALGVIIYLFNKRPAIQHQEHHQ